MRDRYGVVIHQSKEAPYMFSRKILAAAGAVSAAALFFGPVAVASAADSAAKGLALDSASSTSDSASSGSAGSGSAGSSSGSAGSSSGSAGSSSGSAMLDSGSSAADGGTSAIVNIIDAITGVQAMTQPKPAS
ncbi:hypothetical protein [Nocardia sp. NPDC057440]|uniref:hypothetical protein n=1 Tax=Nocardia sp. NPDC057440 TaxID=3346134 RepID=UPI003671C0CD